jgi:hypothetical protein
MVTFLFNYAKQPISIKKSGKKMPIFLITKHMAAPEKNIKNEE